MTPKKVALASLWTVVWLPTVLLITVLALAGDPVEGAREQRQLIGRLILVVGAVVLAAGYWIIFQRRSR